MNKLYTTSFIFFSSFVNAHTISLDVGQTKTNFNRFAVPNNEKDKISLNSNDTLTSYRLTGLYNLKNGNQLYFLLAPLTTNNDFISSKNFDFDGVSYSSGLDTNVNYKFNSYRFGYLWKWNFKNLDLWAGVVGKIRDAKIEVSQGNKSNSYSNVGFVPLVSFGAEWTLHKEFSIYTHTDALTAPQGSAYDTQLELKYDYNKFSFSLGKRILGGGADNDKVYTFAQFDTFYTRLSYRF